MIEWLKDNWLWIAAGWVFIMLISLLFWSLLKSHHKKIFGKDNF